MIWTPPLYPIVRAARRSDPLWQIPLELLEHYRVEPEAPAAAVTVHVTRDTTGLWAATCPETGGSVCGVATPWMALRHALEGG